MVPLLPAGWRRSSGCLLVMVTTDVTILSELAVSIHVDAAPRMEKFRSSALDITDYTCDANLENWKKVTISSVG